MNKFELKLLAKQMFVMYGNKKSQDIHTIYDMIDSCDSPKEAVKWLIEHNGTIDESTKDKLKTLLMDINNDWDFIEFILRIFNVDRLIVEKIKIVYSTSKDANEFLNKLKNL